MMTSSAGVEFELCPTATGNITTSNGILSIGGNAIFGEWFIGKIDEVRIYNRALTASEIQTDMTVPVGNDVTPPTVTAFTPASGSTDLSVGTQPTAKFSEPINQASLASAWEIRDSSGALVPSTVNYDELTASATLVPSVALTYGSAYTVTIKGGIGGLKDGAGNPLAADKVWTFTAEAVPPPILVIS